MPYARRTYYRRARRLRRRGYRASYFRRGRRTLYRRRGYGSFSARKRFYRRRPICRVPGLVIPPTLFARFKCQVCYDLNASTANSADRIKAFYLNNVYDPVVGMSTSSCSGYAQLMQFYDHALVLGFKICVTQYPLGDKNFPTYSYVGFFSSQDGNLLGIEPSTDTLAEMNGRYTVVRNYALAANQKPRRIIKYISCRKLEQVAKLTPADYNCTASMGPAKPSYCVVGFRNLNADNLAEQTLTRFICTLTYYCRLTDRKDNVLSA